MPSRLESHLQFRLRAVTEDVNERLAVVDSKQAEYFTDKSDTLVVDGKRGRRIVSQFGLWKASPYTYDYFYTNLLLCHLGKRRVYTISFAHEDDLFISPYKKDLGLLYVASLYDRSLRKDNDARYKFIMNMHQDNSFTVDWIDRFLRNESLAIARIRNSPSVRRFVQRRSRSPPSGAGRKRSRQ